LVPLWEWWTHPNTTHLANQDICDALLKQMPQWDAEEQLLQLINEDHPNWAQHIAALPKPWSAEFGQAYLSHLRRYVGKLTPETKTVNMNWPGSVNAATHGMPLAPLAELHDEISGQRSSNIHWQQFEQWIHPWNNLHEIVSLRLRIAQEIGS